MFLTRGLIKDLKERILGGGEIAFEEALSLIQIEDEELLDVLTEAAHEITQHFHSGKADVCALVNAKSYLCSEDCAFCAQSVYYQTGASRYSLLPVDAIVEAAKKAEGEGVKSFCIVTSGNSLGEEEFRDMLETVRRIKRETSLNVDGSLGDLNLEQVRALREAGMRRVNSNVQTSPEFYPNIVSTHTFQDRLKALDVLKEGGMEICAGGILGMGEAPRDRVQMAFEIKRYEPRCVPVNLLNPRPGTPLENSPKIEAKDAIKTIAVFRLILPRSVIKLAGGREVNLSEEEQALALRSGANGLVTGGYLTTGGNSFESDKRLLERVGYEAS